MSAVYEEFISIINSAVSNLRKGIERAKDALETNRRLEKEFEYHVLIALNGAATQSSFEFNAMDSPHAFPDIIAEHKSGVCYGIEVKTAKTWHTNGNSIAASISDERIEEIVIVFCKTSDPIEIAFKNYADAITGIQVTHSPRYTLNMNADKPGILEEIGIAYKDFKQLEMNQKVKFMRDWYIKQGRDQDKWWIY